jgi:hypothetical protein
VSILGPGSLAEDADALGTSSFRPRRVVGIRQGISPEWTQNRVCMYIGPYPALGFNIFCGSSPILAKLAYDE